jgi:hypothetical protein
MQDSFSLNHRLQLFTNRQRNSTFDENIFNNCLQWFVFSHCNELSINFLPKKLNVDYTIYNY